MSLTIAEVEHVAHLARLRLSAEELEKMRTDLSAILDHIDMLKEVDVSDVAPTAQVTDLANIVRDDEVRPSMPREPIARPRTHSRPTLLALDLRELDVAAPALGFGP